MRGGRAHNAFAAARVVVRAPSDPISEISLFAPMGFGMVLYRNPHASAAIVKTAKYIIRKDSPTRHLGKSENKGGYWDAVSVGRLNGVTSATLPRRLFG